MMIPNFINKIKKSLFKIAYVTFLLAFCTTTKAQHIPYLKKGNNKTQLIVDNKPFLMLAGELSNSVSGSVELMSAGDNYIPRKVYAMVNGSLGNDTAYDMTYKGSVWQQMTDLNVNTVLAAVSWQMIEPVEGQFDFSVVDAMIEGAREKNLKLIPLWFGSWKNGMSGYAPLWLKKDYIRFPRTKIKDKGSVEVVSTFSEEALKADAKAFAALMKHIKEVDSKHRTVIMVQVENEVGILGDSRDRSKVAERAFNDPVPQKLMDYLIKNKKTLVGELDTLWASTGYKKSGNWTEVFGESVWTDLVFTSWQYATYINHVAKKGKEAYNLPMFVNAWLEYPDRPNPGGFPTGGPLPRVMDVWKAAAPDIDFMSPDIYGSNFVEWCDRYTQQGDPLFVPETWWNKPEYVAYMLYAIGNYNTLGVAPFGIDRLDPEAHQMLTEMYRAVEYLSPQILESQGDKNKIRAFLIDRDNPFVEFEMDDYYVKARLYSRRGKIKVDEAHGLILKTGKNTFTILGSRAVVAFRPKNSNNEKAGLGIVSEYVYRDGKWKKGRMLGGDETNSGRGVFLPVEGYGIQETEIYTYK
ncbi:GH35 family beta-galactosidase [Flavivirga algicola]|uniref:DUF5597 domain-containing protein n=1 Tax=Flavivirga algicola TaxID=2729136 RepID=A0ABX1RU97_9FLAO|nr:DUF5597 domain-containing protein [Flavivirga algicola]NMH86751.1 DUF5597 domain-containing protein [Flavivirga algicola]